MFQQLQGTLVADFTPSLLPPLLPKGRASWEDAGFEIVVSRGFIESVWGDFLGISQLHRFLQDLLETAVVNE